LFGPTEEKDTQGTFVLFRVFSHDELVELKETIGKTGLPIFHHSPTQKGKSEKFFAENKEYLKAVWLSKGKRSKQQPTILRVAFQANVLTEVLLNSLYASVNQGAAGEDDIKHLTLARSQSPTPILIKRESPKDKKSLKYSSRTFGFRKEIDGKETGIFTLLAKYITSVNIVE
ncbi:MAG TPA: hypothetical protein VFV38_16765, partial [Ktedonobacteraceae bacterium]|nr:hypothetical protein [Ktedonobacteraceae bacterium]